MNRKKVYIGAVVLVLLCFGIVVTNGRGFTQAPTYVDTGGDGDTECTDILKVWIDNDATFLRVKWELNGSLDQYTYPVYVVYISVDNSTGTNYGWDLPMDYDFYINFDANGIVYSSFQDYNDVFNDHSDPILAGLMYYSLSNNNRTLEFGYKLQTADGGKGFLNVSMGQTIYLKFQASLTSDLAPNLNLLIRYVLKEAGIPGFELPFLSLAVLTMVVVYFIAKKKATI